MDHRHSPKLYGQGFLLWNREMSLHVPDSILYSPPVYRVFYPTVGTTDISRTTVPAKTVYVNALDRKSVRFQEGEPPSPGEIRQKKL